MKRFDPKLRVLRLLWSGAEMTNSHLAKRAHEACPCHYEHDGQGVCDWTEATEDKPLSICGCMVGPKNCECLWPGHAAIDALAAQDRKWRELLWFSHGHYGLYGDDGEMQCAQGRLNEVAWDFKNDTPERVWRHVYKALAESRGHARNCHCHEHPRSAECYAFIEEGKEVARSHQHPYTDPRCSTSPLPESAAAKVRKARKELESVYRRCVGLPGQR